MDVSVLYFAVPFISRDLHASATQQLWIFDIYGFVLAGFLSWLEYHENAKTRRARGG